MAEDLAAEVERLRRIAAYNRMFTARVEAERNDAQDRIARALAAVADPRNWPGDFGPMRERLDAILTGADR